VIGWDIYLPAQIERGDGARYFDDGEDDHVHLLVSCPKVAISNSLKGVQPVLAADAPGTCATLREPHRNRGRTNRRSSPNGQGKDRLCRRRNGPSR
jgi:hypothetical protein